ncbi:hypothetical protein [Maribacter sp. Hel_I_7]|uniref:hypothetical protein n=1 Tax=Maribacter sp. Hel_I_7 TaxID=1249997 RepID=UPI0012DE05AF|nr:hypothetical protein [Maribacter sp. Hel_I_7]
MKNIGKSVCFILAIISMACSSSDDATVTAPVEAIPEEIAPVETLDFVNAEFVADMPVSQFNTSFVYDDKIYATVEDETYAFDIGSKTWSLLTTDTDTPKTTFDIGLNFIRDGKWYRLIRKGLFVFDFELNDWEVIKSFPLSDLIYSIQGYYVEAENAVYVLDQINRAEIIYKYDLLTNELMEHSTFDNNAGWYPISENAFIINDTRYVAHLNDWEDMEISKFNEDYTVFETINVLETENYLDEGVACQFGDYIIFGLGGVPTGDANGNITRDPSTLNFHYYNTITDTFGTMNTPFYESCRDAQLVTYNNEYYLIGGLTITNNRTEFRSTIEKLQFEIIAP